MVDVALISWLAVYYEAKTGGWTTPSSRMACMGSSRVSSLLQRSPGMACLTSISRSPPINRLVMGGAPMSTRRTGAALRPGQTGEPDHAPVLLLPAGRASTEHRCPSQHSTGHALGTGGAPDSASTSISAASCLLPPVAHRAALRRQGHHARLDQGPCSVLSSATPPRCSTQ